MSDILLENIWCMVSHSLKSDNEENILHVVVDIFAKMPQFTDEISKSNFDFHTSEHRVYHNIIFPFNEFDPGCIPEFFV